MKKKKKTLDSYIRLEEICFIWHEKYEGNLG